MAAPLITPATGADLDAVAALVNAAYRGDAARGGWTSEADLIAGQRTDAATLADELAAPDPSTILVLRDAAGEPIRACVMMQTFRDEAERLLCHLAMLTVRPGDQGLGLGRTLMAAVEERARAAGCAAVEMTVIQLREELIAYYERRGYARTGRTKPFPYRDARFGTPKRPDLHFIVVEKPVGPSV